MVQLLLHNDPGGGSVIPNDEGDTPLSLAAKMQRFDLVALLMKSMQEPFLESPGAPLRLSTDTVDPSSASSTALSMDFELMDINDRTDSSVCVAHGDCPRQNKDGSEADEVHRDNCPRLVEAAMCSISDSPISAASPILCPLEVRRSVADSPYGSTARQRAFSLLSESDEYAFVSNGDRYESDDCVCQDATNSDSSVATCSEISAYLSHRHESADFNCSDPGAGSSDTNERLLTEPKHFATENETSEENSALQRENQRSSPDYGLFVELDFEDDSISQQVQLSTKRSSKEVLVTKEVLSTLPPLKGDVARRLMPRFV